MPIQAECPSCRASFRVKDEYAGKRGRCPQCKGPVTVPAAPPAPADEDGLVPIEDEPRHAGAGLVPLSTPKARVDAEEDATDGYVLADGAGRKAKAVRVREGVGPAVSARAEGVSQAVAATRKTHTPAEVLAAFRGEIEPVCTTPIYAMWTLVVALAMLLLPLVYFGLIGLIAYGVYYHAVHHVVIFQHAGRGSAGIKLAFLLYVAPLVGGAAMVAFLLKPVFARSRKAEKERELDPSVEPLLFAFVDGVCTSVGAPRPGRIVVDCTVNAAAGYRGGPFAVFTREPVLTIGLGMVVGISLKEFAGVMAHELGHISQGSTQRIHVVIGAVNSWFARVVYERDEWDQTLWNWSHDDNGIVILIGNVSRLAVWLARRVLWVLLHVGHLISMVFQRQREYDADRYEARMVGGRTFARTAWRLRELGLASQFAMSDLQSSWQQRRLPDNFPKLILANVPQIPKEALDAFRQAMGQAKTGWFDTHPSDRDRIARARAEEPGEGIFNLDGPATDVFRNFDSLARAATFDYYRSMLGREITKDQLVSVAELVESQAVAQEGNVAADRFFFHASQYMNRLPLPWDYPKPPPDPAGAKRALVEARRRLLESREACAAAGERDSEIYMRLVKAEVGWTLLKTGAKIREEEWGLPAATLRAAEAARDQAKADLRELAEEVAPVQDAVARRLTQVLAILESDTVADRVSEGRDRREEAHALFRCVAHLGGSVVPEVPTLIRARQVLLALAVKMQETKNAHTNAPLVNAVLRASDSLREVLESFRWKVGDTIVYPFEHAQEDITLARFALPVLLPEKENVAELLEISEAAVEKVMTLYRRALGRLAVTVEEVERVLGLPPIEPPEPAPG